MRIKHLINLFFVSSLIFHRARLINFKNESEVYPIVDYEKNLDEHLNLLQKRYYFTKQVWM